MEPKELENKINDTFGNNIISVSEDDENKVVVTFNCNGEPKVYAIKNVKELTSVDDSWTYESGSPTEETFVYTYN